MTKEQIGEIRTKWTSHAHDFHCCRDEYCCCEPHISDPDVAALLNEIDQLTQAAVRLEWHGSAEAVDLCLCLGNFKAPVLQAYPGQWAFAADGRFFGPASEEATKARLAEYVQSLGLPVQMPPMPEFGHADHARQIAAHLEAMGGMPGATP